MNDTSLLVQKSQRTTCFVCAKLLVNKWDIKLLSTNLNSVSSRISSNHQQLITFLQNTHTPSSRTYRFHTEHRRYLFPHLDASRCWHARLGGSAPKPFQQLSGGGFWSCQRCFWCDVFFSRQREWQQSRQISRVSCCCWCRLFFDFC